jgi:hypothetical protein
MNFKHALLALIFTTACTSHIQAQEPTAKSPVTTYEMKSANGTLALVYEGKVERREAPMGYEYLLKHLKLRFNPNAEANTFKEIKVKEIFIVATKKPTEGDGPYTVLHRDKRQTIIVLNASSPTATLENIKYFLPKEIVEKADHVGLVITDGELALPMPFVKSTIAPGAPKSGS